MTNLCLYHKNCPDGFAAALAVEIYFNGDCEFQAVQYGDNPPDVSGKDVLIVDFSFKRDVLLKMKGQAKSLLVIDHHKTAQVELQDLDFCIFDMNKSGAVLTWEYLFPNLEIPKLFAYIQDRDLWQWKLPYSKEISAALRSYPSEFEIWLEFLDDRHIQNLITDGQAILRYQQRTIEGVLKNKMSYQEIGGHTVPCINSTTLISELGNEMCKDNPFAACYFDTNDGKRVFSLRSNDDGIDVSEVARQYGGGGHRNAAGFRIERPKVI